MRKHKMTLTSKREEKRKELGKTKFKKSDLTTLSKMSLVLGLGGLRIVVFNGFFSKDRDLKGKEKKERVRISTGKPKKKERESGAYRRRTR